MTSNILSPSKVSRKYRISLYQEHVTSFRQVVKNIKADNADAAVVNICHPSILRGVHAQLNYEEGEIGVPSDTILGHREWTHKLIAKLSDWYDVDSVDAIVQARDERGFVAELESVQHVMRRSGDVLMALRMCNGTRNHNLARLLSHLKEEKIIIEVPLTARRYSAYRDDRPTHETIDTWSIWNDFRMRANFGSHIKLALEITRDNHTQAELNRWLSEPIKYIILTNDIFEVNNMNIPVLMPEFKEIVRRFLRITSHVIFKNVDPNAHDSSTYAYYLPPVLKELSQHDPFTLYTKRLMLQPQSLVEPFSLRQYEVYEKDTAKFELYEKALYMAVQDLDKKLAKDEEMEIVILGAGRGFLVRALINALTRCRKEKKVIIRPKVTIVEENPNNKRELLDQIKLNWKHHAHIKHFSSFPTDQTFHIVVCDFLGAFGDNELLPERIEEPMKRLKQPYGFCIPFSTTSYISPIMSSDIFHASRVGCVTKYGENDLVKVSPAYRHETPYVVYPKNAYKFASPCRLFTFVYGLDRTLEFTRNRTVEFSAEADAILHGFLGYFVANLYKGITLSTHPGTSSNEKTKRWFPYFFPMKSPRLVKADEPIVANMWRFSREHQTWYEWSITKPFYCHIHNYNGNAHVIKRKV